jgi:uncharacterized protein (DUF1501 family)
MSLSRRSFLKNSGIVGFGAAAASFAQSTMFERMASAAPGDPYRALVGVFLLGGNDANNLLIPRSDAGYAKYSRVRTAANIGIPKDELVAINPRDMAAGSFGLHPKLTRLGRLFNEDRKVALVCNVGPLVEPTTIQQIRAGTAVLPDNLMSHPDQQDAWASAIPDPFHEGGRFTGWGGRTADKIRLLNEPSTYPVSTFFSGRALFTVGNEERALVVPSDGKLELASSGKTSVNRVRDEAMGSLFDQAGSSELGEAYRGVFGGALANAGARKDAIAGNPLPPEIAALFSETTLGTQLHRIAEEIVAGASAAESGLNLSRQLFSAGLGGFDTHNNQLETHDSLYLQIDEAFDAFYQAIAALNDLIERGMLPGITRPLEATLFTMSDFARTFSPNSGGGTDHAWGSHMIVLGSRVRGGALYGTFPDLELRGNDDIGDEGRWLPSTSSDQYANTLSTWFGVTESGDTDYVFPKLENFDVKTLDFMRR